MNFSPPTFRHPFTQRHHQYVTDMTADSFQAVTGSVTATISRLLGRRSVVSDHRHRVGLTPTQECGHNWRQTGVTTAVLSPGGPRRCGSKRPTGPQRTGSPQNARHSPPARSPPSARRPPRPPPSAALPGLTCEAILTRVPRWICLCTPCPLSSDIDGKLTAPLRPEVITRSD